MAMMPSDGVRDDDDTIARIPPPFPFALTEHTHTQPAGTTVYLLSDLWWVSLCLLVKSMPLVSSTGKNAFVRRSQRTTRVGAVHNISLVESRDKPKMYTNLVLWLFMNICGRFVWQHGRYIAQYELLLGGWRSLGVCGFGVRVTEQCAVRMWCAMSTR